MDELVPLDRLQAGQSARVGRIVGPADDVHRLEEFGLHGGTKIQMFRPGNPCIIRTAGSKVCLRTDRLLSILVKLNAPPGQAGSDDACKQHQPGEPDRSAVVALSGCEDHSS